MAAFRADEAMYQLLVEAGSDKYLRTDRFPSPEIALFISCLMERIAAGERCLGDADRLSTIPPEDLARVCFNKSLYNSEFRPTGNVALLDVAAHHGDRQLVGRLLVQMAKVIDGQSVSRALARAIRGGRIDIVDDLLRTDVDLKVVNENGFAIIHIALEKKVPNRTKAVQMLLDYDPQEGKLPLRLAVNWKAPPAVLLALIAAGAHPDEKDPDIEMSPFELAAHLGLSTAQEVLAKAMGR